MATTLGDHNFEFPVPLPLAHRQPVTGPARGPEVLASPSNPNVLRNLYSGMLRCRMLEERARELASDGRRKSPVNLSAGLEATSIGSMMELRAGDAVSSELSIPSRLMCGQPMGLVLAGLYGVDSEYPAFAPDGANPAILLLPAAETVEARLNMAAGFAIALRRTSSADVVLVHLPDGFSALGFWHEAANVAVAEHLPLIFVAVSEFAKANSAGDHVLRERAAAYGIPGITVDGNDVVAVWRVAQESIFRARSGSGPTLIHTQVVSAPANSHSTLKAGDPIARMQRYLEKRKLWDESWKLELVRRFTAEADEAVSFFRPLLEAQERLSLA